MTAADATLPPLREDLILYPGPAAFDGSPTWTVHDPGGNQFHRLGHLAFEMISRWDVGDADTLLQRVAHETGLKPVMTDVQALLTFLRSNTLLKVSNPEGVANLGRQAAAGRPPWYKWLLYNYLFIRIPLIRPDRFLSASQFLLRPFFTRGMAILVIVLGLLGLVMVLQQWDGFTATFVHFFNWQGAVRLGAALIIVKILHEFGHAYAAKRQGCRVSAMGLAFLVLWPVFYTETSDAWRLPSKRQRMIISAAGILVELGLAAFALFLWGILPEGPVRGIAFLVATTTWIATLAINLNIFMRFDGYYLLADWLEVDNLFSRSFALARWRLREWLFRFGEPPPERLPKHLGRFLVLFAWGTWIYRLFLFLGIAWLVYTLAFKLLGIFLAAVEIAWFILRPLRQEMTVWWQQRGRIRFNFNLLMAGMTLGGMVWLLFTPWNSTVSIPAVWQAAGYADLYAPDPAQILETRVERNQVVVKNQLLFHLASPELENEIRLEKNRQETLRIRLRRQAASEEERENRHVLQQELSRSEAKLSGLLEQRKKLTIRAPFQGMVVDLAKGLTPGRWLDPESPLAVLVDHTANPELVGFVSEVDLTRIQPGLNARFFPDDPVRPSFDAEVKIVSEVNTTVLDIPLLASEFGGSIPVRRADKDLLVPEHGIYRVTLTTMEPLPFPGQVIIGEVGIQGEAKSLAERMGTAIGATMIRESGF